MFDNFQEEEVKPTDVVDEKSEKSEEIDPVMKKYMERVSQQKSEPAKPERQEVEVI